MSDGFLFEGSKETEEHFPNFFGLGERITSGDETHTCSQQELSF